MEEKSDGGKRPRPCVSYKDLGDIVLSWSLDQILDEGLFKVEKLPPTFYSVGHYLESFSVPLMEETRSDLCSSLSDISNAPCSRIISIEKGEKKRQSGTTLEYYVDVGFFKNYVDGSNKNYKARNGDLFILSNIELQAVEDLCRHSVTYCFALVTEVAVDEGLTKGFAVNISKDADLEDGISSFSFACFVTNLLTYIRIWKALAHAPGMNSNFRVIQEVLSPKPMMTVRDSPNISEEIDNLLTNLTNTFSLNQSQINAVRTVIHATGGTVSNSVELIWGPPGTGKTKTVTAMLWLFLHMQCRTLICAPTNVAVVGVCCRLLQLVEDIRIHDSQDGLPLSLSNIVLFGNRDRMEIHDELQDVFLDYRVDQLLGCLAPLTGWRHRISSAIHLFEDCSLTFEMFVENRPEKMEESFNFSEFLRKQFDAVMDPVKDCLLNLRIHTNYISSQNASKVSVLLGLLEKMRILIWNADLDDVKLREVFSQDIANPIVLHDTVSSAHGFCTSEELLEARIKVVHLLKHLQSTLSLPDKVDKNFIRKFCIQNATIIFCTVSSSSMLHYLDMDPLRILVIDEAAQLKECESVIPLRLNGLRCAILVGDECQLPAMIKSQICKDAGFGVSLFERLACVGQRKHLLNIQYRMHPHISFFPNFRFYRKQIQDGPNVLDGDYNTNFKDLLFGPYAFVNVADGREEMDDKSLSKRNMVEVAVVCFLVEILYKQRKSFPQVLSIGVISPYVYQIKAIKDKLGSRYESEADFDVRVNSIDGFQGEENDVIILSTVRSNLKGNIGFLHDRQRTNVALTRARHCLWIVGNANTLALSSTIWEDVVNDAKARCCFYNAKDNANLSKVILHVKHEFDQLDDLLRSDSVFLSNARWKVLFSDDFKISFAKLRQIQCKMQVIKLLENLAEGWRSKIRFEGFSSSFELIRVNKVNDFYVIWTVDIKKDDRYIQVLKVWDILPLEQIARLVSRLDHIFSLYTETYMNYCKYTCTQEKLEVPMSWNAVQDIVCYKALSQGESTEEEVSGDMDLLMGMENSKVSESLVLMKFYSLSFGVARHMLTASDGTELDIPFELTDQEKEIVRFPLSTFILGRSGTGKTTVLTMKLIQKEQVFSISSDGPSDSAGSYMVAETSVLSTSKRNFLKQVFITVSPKLCSAIMSHAHRLQSFASGVEVASAPSSHYMHDNNELSDFHGIPDSFCNLQHQHFPLFITFRKFLLMLDGTMSRSFFDKYYSRWEVSPDQNGGPKSFALQAFMQSKEVNYEKFFRSYWPHFDEQLTKMVDPSTVFTQIISHIKGGVHSGMVHTGRLSREEYLLLSEKRVSTLSQQSREIIYEIFIDYENQKLLASEYDLTDFTNYLHYQLSCDSYVGDMIDFVYIDEVQDLTMRQIALLKYVCRNFKEGYTFAGDTAQTIARGIDFRFEDIRSLFYTEFLSELKGRQPQKETEIRMADMFHLNQNFRTHTGILSLAQSIMVVLYFYFPQSVDKLDPEFSLVYGEAPVLLESDNDENVILTIFGNSGSMLSGSNGFGAEQVILVRDEETKEQICSLVGKQALVLTILECKGLEFQDVLLYNFFGTSPLKRRWRVIYEYMEKHGIFDPSLSRAFSSFRLERHNLLCSELKQLYVAITRTKQRLWISENADEYCKPMFDYWKKLGLVQVRHLDASIAQAMKSSSSAEDWRTRGIKLFNEGNFELATMCFEKAGDAFNEKWAKAAGLVANAEHIISTNFDMAEIALKNAAEIYVSIGKPDSAATCYIKSKDFKSAGNIYIEKCGMSRLKDAGDCFAMAKCWTLAADAYAGGKFFSDCLLVCSRGRIYDTGLQKIEQWKGASLSDEQLFELNNLISPFLKNCLLHYLGLGDIQKVLLYAKTFQSNDSQEELLSLIREFLKSKDLDSLLLIEQELGNYLEAAAIAKFMGNIPLEVEMLEKAKCFEEAAMLLILHILVRSLWSRSSNGWPLKGFAEKKELLMKVKELSKQKEGSFEEFVNLEASILSDGSKSLIDMSKHLVQAQKLGSLRQEVFSARTILDAHVEGNPHKFFCQVQVPFSNSEKLAYDNKSQNHLTLETMMYAWNLWKGIIVNLLCYLKLPNETREYCCRYEEFYLEYFGVRTVDNDRYAIQNPEANWIKNKYSLRREKNLVFITTEECESCAIFYWSAELFAVGKKVLDSLGNLHSHYKSKLAYSFCRAKVAISMYEIAKFLMTSDSTASISTSKMERYLSLSQSYYLETVTPLDWKNDTMENVKFLRENKIALEIIDASLRDNLKPWNGNLSHGQIGRLVALLLVTGKLPDVLFEEIRECLRDRQHWNDFIQQYKIFLDQGFGRIPLLNRFKIALENTFRNPNWRREKDYMSPHHFISLMEKLMFIASSCRGLKGNIFTTKYSLLEILKCQGCSGFMTTCLPAISVDLKSSVQSTLDFISTTAKCILNDRRQLFSWISNSNMSRESHSVLALRLVILLLIGCLNSGRSIHQLMRFLFQINQFCYLPKPFSKRLESIAVHTAMVHTPYIELVAEALITIENPLVIILSKGCSSMFSNLNALTIDSEDIKCHQKVCSLLFPENQPVLHAEQFEGLPFSKSAFEISSSLNTTKQDINSIPSSNPEESVFQDEVIDNQSESLPIKESSFEIDSLNAICQNIECIPSEKPEESILGNNNIGKQSVQGDENVYVELTEECKQFWQKTKGFLSGEHDDVDDTISLLGTVLRWMQQKAETKEFDEHLITEMVDMRDRIKLLASMIPEEIQAGYPTKDELLANWMGLRASLEPLLETLFPHCQSTTEEARPSDNNDDSDENNSDCDPNIHEAEAEAKAESSSTNQTKVSKWQKKKTRKKKGKEKSKKRK